MSEWKRLVTFVLRVAALAVVVSILLPKYYRSSATILPGNEAPTLSGLSALSGLASVAGLSIGQSSLEELYPDIMLSEAVLRDVIYHSYRSQDMGKEVNLVEYWRIEGDDQLENFEDALEKMRRELEVSYDRRKSIISVAIVMKEPQLAADVLTQLVQKLDNFMRTKRTTNASEQRKWIDSRLAEVKTDLSKSEEALREFREKNRRVSDSPQLQLIQERLLRDLMINSTIYEELKKQFELAKIEEIKNTPIINIMDSPRPAGKKELPKRRLIVLASSLLALFLACSYVIVKEVYAEEVQKLIQSLIPGKIIS